MKWIPPMPKGSLSHLRIGTSRFPKDAANPMDAVKQAMLTGTTAPAAGLSSRYRARMGAVWRYNSLPPKDLVETASLRMHLLLPPLGVLSRRGTAGTGPRCPWGHTPKIRKGPHKKWETNARHVQNSAGDKKVNCSQHIRPASWTGNA